MLNSVPDDGSIMWMMRQELSLPIEPYLKQWIEYSVISNTYQILMDQEDNPCGYIIWANVNRETIQRIIRVGVYPKFIYEWREGGICLILDIFNRFEKSPFVASQLNSFVRKKRIISYKRNGKPILKYRKKNLFCTLAI